MIYMYIYRERECVCPVQVYTWWFPEVRSGRDTYGTRWYKCLLQSFTSMFSCLCCIQRKVMCRSWAHASMPSRFVFLAPSSLSIFVCLQPTYLHLLYSTSDFIITGEVNIVATLVSWATSRSKFGTNKSFGAFGAPRELKGAMAPLPFRSADASPNESNDPNKQTIADDIILQIIVVC